ncbi:MAG: peptide deformylase [Candidatus Tokpelaia sp. JSC189]|nr:MAG: peptide deformylase [Candidatus Tokpelaia sp. JSC189]
MTIKPLIIFPNPLLREVSKPVAVFDDRIVWLASDMLESMYHASGIGLAAIQIGKPLRLLVIDLADKDKPKKPQIFINPEIVWTSDERNVYQEGCLSIPNYYADVERPKKMRLTYFERDGEKQEIEAEGLLAVCLQHEVDHLNGILFIDHISRLKRDMVIRKFRKRARDMEECVAI